MVGGDLWLGLYSHPPSETDRNGSNGIVKQELGSFRASCGFVATMWPFEVLQSDRSKQPQLRASPGSGPLYVAEAVGGRECVRVRVRACVCVRVFGG